MLVVCCYQGLRILTRRGVVRQRRGAAAHAAACGSVSAWWVCACTLQLSDVAVCPRQVCFV
jgi:hypothetical protein